jgi:hypothetical protein
VSNSQVVSTLLPDESVSYQVSELILKNRMVRRGDANITQVLVKWSNMC